MRSAAIALLLAGPTSFGCIVLDVGDDDDSADGDADGDVDGDSDADSDSDANPLTSGRYVGTVLEIGPDWCIQGPEEGTSWDWNVDVSGDELRMNPVGSAPQWTLFRDGEDIRAYFADEAPARSPGVGDCDVATAIDGVVNWPGFDLNVSMEVPEEAGCGTWCETWYDVSVVPAE